MKIPLFALLLLPLTAANPFVPKSSRLVAKKAPVDRGHQPPAVVVSESAHRAALRLRGGDGVLGTGITRKTIAKFLAHYFVLHGALGAADAGMYWSKFDMNIKPGSIAAWAGEHNGWAPLGLAVVSLLSLHTNMDPQVASAYASLPCCFFFFKGWFSGQMETLGFNAAVAPVMVIYCLGLVHAAIEGWVDADLLKILTWAPIGAFGVLGCLSPEASASLVGIDKFADATDKALWKFQSMALAIVGAFIYTLLSGSGDPVEAMRNAMVMWTVWAVDLRFVRNDVLKDAGFSENGANAFLAFIVVMTGLLFANES